jgi:SAM-dependent methyltransferase
VTEVSDEAECPICGTVADVFEAGGHPSHPRPDCRCPRCGSLERHRALWLYFRDRTTLFTEPVRMLHVAPDGSMGSRWAALPNVDYLSADLDPAKAMVGMDLTSIDLPDATFDLILVSHVLEHIPDDRAAMRELRRVLRQGGQAVLSVPIIGKVTTEDLTVTDPAERLRRFGQEDHVRRYGRDGVFEDRLRAAGFDVTPDPIIEDMTPDLRRRYRVLSEEPIFVCTFGVAVVPRAPIGTGAHGGDAQATVWWSPAPGSDPAALTGYEVTPYLDFCPLPSSRCGPDATTCTITGLTNGASYRFRVRASNDVGTGPYSKVTNLVTPTA